MDRASTESYVSEYTRLLNEGWKPDVAEFLHRVPEELREATDGEIQKIIRDREAEPDAIAAAAPVAVIEAPEAPEPFETTDGFEFHETPDTPEGVGAIEILTAPEIPNAPEIPDAPETSAAFEISDTPGMLDAFEIPDPRVMPDAGAQGHVQESPERYEHDDAAHEPEEAEPELSPLTDTERLHPAQLASRVERTPPVLHGYRVNGRIGGGSLGDVYFGLEEESSTSVAIKVLRGEMTEGVRRNIVEDARRAAKLTHPAFVPVTGISEDAEFTALIMPKVSGQPFDRGCEGLSAKAKTRALRILAQALTMAHMQKLVHRAIHPRNILLEDGRPRILDFGLYPAIPLEGADRRDPHYLAPEQVAGRATTSATDMFAFGALMYAVLTGRAPFLGSSPKEIRDKIASQDPRYPRQIDPRIPRDLQSICLSCLARNPRERPSARDVADDLGRFLRGEPARLRPAMYRHLVQRNLAEQQVQIDLWHEQGIVSAEERDQVTSLVRSMHAAEDQWISDPHRISIPQVMLHSATALVAAGAGMLAITSATTFAAIASTVLCVSMLAAGAFCYWRKEVVGGAVFWAGGALATGPVLLRLLESAGSMTASGATELLAAGPFSNYQLTAAAFVTLLAAAGGLMLYRRVVFAWLAAFAALATQLGLLLSLGGLDWATEVQGARLMSTLLLVGPAVLLEHTRRFRWARPFFLLSFLFTWCGLELLAYSGGFFKLMGITAAAPWNGHAIGFLMAGILLLIATFVMEQLPSLSLRRAARLCEWMAPAHLVGALVFVALGSPSFMTLTGLAVTNLFLVALAPWRARKSFLVCGLIGLGFATTLPLALGLVPVAAYSLGLAAIGLIGASVAYRLRLRPAN